MLFFPCRPNYFHWHFYQPEWFIVLEISSDINFLPTKIDFWTKMLEVNWFESFGWICFIIQRDRSTWVITLGGKTQEMRATQFRLMYQRAAIYILTNRGQENLYACASMMEHSFSTTLYVPSGSWMPQRKQRTAYEIFKKLASVRAKNKWVENSAQPATFRINEVLSYCDWTSFFMFPPPWLVSVIIKTEFIKRKTSSNFLDQIPKYRTNSHIMVSLRAIQWFTPEQLCCSMRRQTANENRGDRWPWSSSVPLGRMYSTRRDSSALIINAWFVNIFWMYLTEVLGFQLTSVA